MKKYILLSLWVLTLFSCQEKIQKSFAISDTDLYANTIAESQYFKVNTKTISEITGAKGTKILFESNSFLDKDGEIVNDVSIELIEALTMETMILSNLTTQSNGQFIETDGMVFIEAFDLNNNKLTINHKAPLNVEIPTLKKKSGMMVYDGIRDTQGNMNWVKPKPLIKTLDTLPLSQLNFLPPNFEKEIDSIFPNRTFDKSQKDSIYYTIKHQRSKVYFCSHFQIDMASTLPISPLDIKTLKSQEFQNSYIATKEFEKRVQILHIVPDSKLLTVYLNHINGNLWEADEEILKKLNKYYNDVKEFADESWWQFDDLKLAIKQYEVFVNEKYTNIEASTKTKIDLNIFYEKELNRLIKKQDEWLSSQKSSIKRKELEKLQREHLKIVKKREKRRMLKYKFELTTTGWKNIDRGVLPKNWSYQDLVVSAKIKDEKIKTINIYCLFTEKKIITKLSTYDNLKFQFNKELERVQVPKNNEFLILGIMTNTKGEYFFGEEKVKSSDNDNYLIKGDLQFTTISFEKMKDKIKSFDKQYEGEDLYRDIRLSEKIQNLKHNLKKDEILELQLNRAAYRYYPLHDHLYKEWR